MLHLKHNLYINSLTFEHILSFNKDSILRVKFIKIICKNRATRIIEKVYRYSGLLYMWKLNCKVNFGVGINLIFFNIKLTHFKNLKLKNYLYYIK